MIGAAQAGTTPGTQTGPAALDPTTGRNGQPAGAAGSQPPVFDQVAKHLAGMRTLRDGTQRTVLRLAPEHLGALTLTVDVRAGAVHLAVAGNEAALAALRDGLDGLRDQLGQAGLDLGDVSLQQNAADPGRGGQSRPDGGPTPQLGGDGAAGSGSGAAPRQDQPGRGGPGPNGSNRPDPAAPRSGSDGAPAPAARGSDRAGRTGSLDVRV